MVVDCPQIAELLDKIASQLKLAAGRVDSNTNIYIIASPEINAFSLPNGDIFIWQRTARST